MRRNELERQHDCSARQRLAVVRAFALACLACSFFAVTAPAQKVPIKNYIFRLDQSERIIDSLTEGEPPAERVVRAMGEVKRLLPEREEIESQGQVFPVDNYWLHEAADNVVKNANADAEQRRSLLVEIQDRLALLLERVKAGQATPEAQTPSDNDHRAHLESILARPEYRPEELKESSVRSIMRRVWKAIVELLSRLKSDRRSTPVVRPSSGGGVFRVFILLLFMGALFFGLATLLKRLRLQRSSKPEKKEAREVLGEEIDGDVTAADLFARAAELARLGDYRAAIRRAYISVLVELEQRGKLRLHQARTNRDYLDALHNEDQIYPPFSSMTGAYERVWYGEEKATNVEFEQFIQVYRRLAESAER